MSEVAFLEGVGGLNFSQTTQRPASLLVESDFTISAFDEQAWEPWD